MALVSINWKPAETQLRQFGLAALGFALLVAGMMLWRHGPTPWVWIVGSAGLLMGLIGVAWPEGLRYPYVAAMAVTYPIGWLVSMVVLVVIYYGLFTLVALIFRLVGRDALQRRFDPQAPTYWQPKVMPTDPRRYLRQY